MIEGERVKSLVANARKNIILCAPFIKRNALSVILAMVPDGIPVQIITRWRPAEVAAGVSDLEIFDIVKDRPATSLNLLDPLHAKLFVADERCLVGSSNITGAALGWSGNPNIELLVEVKANDPFVSRLLEQLAGAVQVTYQLKAEIEEQAKKIEKIASFSEIDLDDFDVQLAERAWLPQCAAPEKLFVVYQNQSTETVVSGTRNDAISDLRALQVPQGLAKEAFYAFIASSLDNIPALATIMASISGRLTDERAVKLVLDIRSDFSDRDAKRQWAILRDWISEFLCGKYEVAAESFVVRIKS